MITCDSDDWTLLLMNIIQQFLSSPTIKKKERKRPKHKGITQTPEKGPEPIICSYPGPSYLLCWLPSDPASMGEVEGIFGSITLCWGVCGMHSNSLWRQPKIWVLFP